VVQVEVNASFLRASDTFESSQGAIAVTPPLDEGYWIYRVPLKHGQAIVAFPKFFTVGCGFAQEEDWNTNLPISCSASEIYNHIEHNKKYDDITREECIAAIEAIQWVVNQRKAEAARG